MTRIRLRTDHRFIADFKARGIPYRDWCTREEWDSVPPAEPGDVWRCRWLEGGIAGYDICCPGCRQVHAWNVSHNCGSRVVVDGVRTCEHTGVSSCWQWTGSAEEGTLTASPSLWADVAHGGCGWHGFLSAGVMRSV